MILLLLLLLLLVLLLLLLLLLLVLLLLVLIIILVIYNTSNIIKILVNLVDTLRYPRLGEMLPSDIFRTMFHHIPRLARILARSIP